MSTATQRIDLELLKKLYDEQGLTVDMLPHSEQERMIVESYNALKHDHITKREVYIALMNLRKRSKLKRKPHARGG